MRDLLESLDSIAEAPAGEKALPPGSTPFKGSFNNKTSVLRKGPDGRQYVVPKNPSNASGELAATSSAVTPAAPAKGTKVTPTNAPKVDADDMANMPKYNRIDKSKSPTPVQTGGKGGEFATVSMPKAPPAKPKYNKVKATAANTKDFDKTMALQKKLQKAGYDIAADGLMGPNTRAALKKYNAAQTARSDRLLTGKAVKDVRTGDAKTKGPDPMGIFNPSPEVKAQGQKSVADRRAERQQKSRDFFRSLYRDYIQGRRFKNDGENK